MFRPDCQVMCGRGRWPRGGANVKGLGGPAPDLPHDVRDKVRVKRASPRLVCVGPRLWAGGKIGPSSGAIGNFFAAADRDPPLS